MSRMVQGIFLIIFFSSQTVFAGPSEKWRAATFTDFSKGDFENTVVTSDGEISIGLEAKAIPIPPGDTALIWSSLEMADGTIYLGTGSNGALLKYKNGKIEQVTKTDGMILTSLANAGNGAVYAGSLPAGKIFKIDAKGNSETFVDLEAEHVWGLVSMGSTLYAATGPDGNLYAIDSKGKSKVLYDSTEEHLLSIAPSQDKMLLVGTSKNGLLLKIAPSGKTTAVWDFDGQEVRAIQTFGDDIYAAVNTVSIQTDATGKPKKVGSKKGGAVFRIRKDGRVEELYQNKNTYFTDIDVSKKGVFVSSGTDGKIYQIDPEKRSTQIAFDVPERQVLTLHLSGKSAAIFGCGDAATLYRVSDGVPKKASYFSDVIDTKYLSSFGKLYFAGQGKLSFRTRSGNTEKPDTTWSSWSAPQNTSNNSIKSPSARYLQVRFDWGTDASAAVTRIDVYYQPQNQRARITEVKVGDETSSSSSKTSSASSKQKISWKTENPDKDKLYGYLWYKAEGESNWKPLNDGNRLDNKSDYTWETDAIPDGFYQVKIVLSDIADNPKESALSTETLSPPFLVDNGKPMFSSDLTISGNKVAGKVEDGFSPLQSIEYSIDGAEWNLVGVSDGIYDDKRENFSFEIDVPDTGSHTLAIRAKDAAGNMGVVRKQFEKK